MKKAIFITTIMIAATLEAQNHFQNPAWFGVNNVRRGPEVVGQSGPVTGKPFSGVETRQTRQVLSDGTPTSTTSVTRIFRDAEGRMRSESGGTVLLFDAPNHVNYTLNRGGCTKRQVRENDSVIIVAEEHGSQVSTQGGTGGPISRVRPLAQHVVSEDLGFQVIDGISAQGTRQTISIPAQTVGSDHDLKVINERWYSESLGILLKSSNVDPRFGSTTYELTDLKLASPDASLFTPPAGCSDDAVGARNH